MTGLSTHTIWKTGHIFTLPNKSKYLASTYGLVTNEGDAIMLEKTARSFDVVKTTKIPRAAERIKNPQEEIIDFKVKLFLVTVSVSLGIKISIKL